MLEVLFLWFLTRQIRKIVEPKGRKPFGYQTMLVAFWFGGEIVGAFIGFLLFSEADLQCLVYIPALLGAALGAGVAFLIASSLSPAVPQIPYDPGASIPAYPGQLPPASGVVQSPTLEQMPPAAPGPGTEATPGSQAQ